MDKDFNKLDNTKLYIPLNVTNRDDFIQGFGKKELKEAIFGLIIVIPAGLITYIITKQTLPMLITFFVGTFGIYTLVAKDNNNISVLDLIKSFIKFQKEQKIYPYRPKNEF